MASRLGSALLGISVAVLAATASPKASGTTGGLGSDSMNTGAARSFHTHLSVAYDPGLTMRSGADNVLSAGHGIASAEDRLIGTRWFSEDSFHGKAGAAMCRLAKYSSLDLPVDWFLSAMVCRYRGIPFDLNLDVWRQPQVLLLDNHGESVTSKGANVGGAFSIRGHYDITDSRHALSAFVELGYKSPGFLLGYGLDSSPIVIVGIGLRQ